MVRVTELEFSDFYYTPEHISYIPDKRVNGALIVVEPDDIADYVKIDLFGTDSVRFVRIVHYPPPYYT